MSELYPLYKFNFPPDDEVINHIFLIFMANKCKPTTAEETMKCDDLWDNLKLENTPRELFDGIYIYE